jgi:hypothetical protein
MAEINEPSAAERRMDLASAGEQPDMDPVNKKM